MKTCLLDSFGGYLIVRYDENENPTLDYFSDVPDTSTQRIEFGENLIALVLTKNASETYTACVPLGAALRAFDPESESDARLTIESVNEGQEFLIDVALAAEYGVIFAPPGLTTWDDITDATILMNRGHDWLSGTGARFKQTNTHTLATAELPSHNHSFSGSVTVNVNGAHTHQASSGSYKVGSGSASTYYYMTNGGSTSGQTTGSGGSHDHSLFSNQRKLQRLVASCISQ